uniref:Uncharacterized protein n=1 Tax=Rhizophora mucronata TaxID=61149 RepID=A0A2P2QEQ2_RHIMU
MYSPFIDYNFYLEKEFGKAICHLVCCGVGWTLRHK